jgi:catechol 2,3-dioxygenase-like lactoylglutathione lyase family enzyme
MERFIADLVQGLDSGKIDRREFCKAVALAAAVYGAGDAAQAQAQRGFKVIGINHISYTCPDYTKARDWYQSVLNMKITSGRDDGKRANLEFGPEPGEGGSFLAMRNPDNIASGSSGTTRRAEAVIDHICYTVPQRDARARNAESEGARRHRARRQPACLRPVQLRCADRIRGRRKRFQTLRGEPPWKGSSQSRSMITRTARSVAAG